MWQPTHIDAVGDDVLEEVSGLGGTEGPGAAVGVGQLRVLLDVATLLSCTSGSAARNIRESVYKGFWAYNKSENHEIAIAIMSNNNFSRADNESHTSKIPGLSQKKMYIGFFARYQLYNISIDEIYCFWNILPGDV